MFDAVKFSKVAAFSLRHAYKYLSRSKGYFKWSVSEEILDIGCADGQLTRKVLFPFVEKHLGHLIGGDIDDTAIAVAMREHSAEKMSFSRMDAEDLALGNVNRNKFDHIFAFYLLHWVSPERWPRNFFNMIKPGGQLFASIYLSPNPVTKTVEKLKLLKDKSWFPYFDGCQSTFQDFGASPIEAVSSILKEAGFIVDLIDIVEISEKFSSEAFVELMMTAHKLDTRASADVCMEYSRDLSEELLRHVERDGDMCFLIFKTLIFVASKP